MKKNAKKAKQSQSRAGKTKPPSKIKKPQTKIVKSPKSGVFRNAEARVTVKTKMSGASKKNFSPRKNPVSKKSSGVSLVKKIQSPKLSSKNVVKTPAKKLRTRPPEKRMPVKNAQTGSVLKKNPVKKSNRQKEKEKLGIKALSKPVAGISKNFLKTIPKKSEYSKARPQSKSSAPSPRNAAKLKSSKPKLANTVVSSGKGESVPPYGKRMLQPDAENSIPTAKPSKKVRILRPRPSQNISFTLEDLDWYLSHGQIGNAPTSKEVSVLKSTGKKGKTSAASSRTSVPTAKRKAEVASLSDILGFNPVEAPTREKVESRDIPRKWKKYYGKLMELRKHHSQGIEIRVEEVHKRSAKEDSGDLSSYGQHLADAGSESFERDMAYNLLLTSKEVLFEIDEAVKRMKNGTYGICEVTGKPISEDRLWSIPFTRYSKEGQEIKEIEQRHTKSSQNSIYEMPSDGVSTEDETEDNS